MPFQEPTSIVSGGQVLPKWTVLDFVIFDSDKQPASATGCFEEV
jgi:hypothetical protein